MRRLLLFVAAVPLLRSFVLRAFPGAASLLKAVRPAVAFASFAATGAVDAPGGLRVQSGCHTGPPGYSALVRPNPDACSCHSGAAAAAVTAAVAVASAAAVHQGKHAQSQL